MRIRNNKVNVFLSDDEKFILKRASSKLNLSFKASLNIGNNSCVSKVLFSIAIFISESVEIGGILLAAIGVGCITACLIKLEIDLYNYLKAFFE